MVYQDDGCLAPSKGKKNKMFVHLFVAPDLSEEILFDLAVWARTNLVQITEKFQGGRRPQPLLVSHRDIFSLYNRFH